ncbi:hypothetical protein JAAARDRAFT_697737 [Jaapia argillacea MUCL 33604]|uniref:Helicase ATP-binding domain-containing protein n=1 Tax=Jaapia argillacea MUCL 33604 TaxID=933084 RepID=A0A067PGW4_9AGAM|nr:hypothetical protein JAAARDRAFT_697737 [Jaapia argillacea MUCL 33604]
MSVLSPCAVSNYGNSLPSPRTSNQAGQSVNPRPLPTNVSRPQPALQSGQNKATPIHIPSNRDLPKPSGFNPNVVPSNRVPSNPPATQSRIPSNPSPTNYNATTKDALWETFDVPDANDLYDPRTSAEEAEKALRALCEDTMAQDAIPDDIDLEKDSIVEGFRAGIKLLPHQVVGRKWMREREEGKKTGGILADDMGLGKTIQTLTRIVEGRPRKENKKEGWAPPTLIICPLALVSQWHSEAEKMCVGLTVIQHHGPKRTTNPEVLKRAHMVVTTYQVVDKEYQSYQLSCKNEGGGGDSDDSDDDSDNEHFGRTLAKAKKTAKKNGTKGRGKQDVKDALFRVKWWRLVLDEAHNIKNRKTKMAIACCELQGKFRWCLTGTPLQNSVEDLYSLIKFLQIRPLNDWDKFNEQISKPVKAGRSVRAMKRLQIILKAIMLRRKKDTLLNGRPLLQLPDRNVNVVHCDFDEDERSFYDDIEQKVSKRLDSIERAGEMNKNYTQILVLLLRLRQACDHPALISQDYRKDTEALQPRAASTVDDEDDDDDLAGIFGKLGISKKCGVCQKDLNFDNISEEDGAHCLDCASVARKARRKSTRSGPSDLPPNSSKTRKILELLREIEERGEGEKTIIFSQFTSMLDLIEPFLDAEGFKYVRYDGSMSKDHRDASLTQIRKSNSTKVILISFKAGSTGLNLTACNNVILVDLWWNPALEDQAFDRAHRFGQERDVHIHKLVVENTVEERILELQAKKRELAAAALSGDKMKNSKLGLDDLMALFRHGGRDDEDDDE